MKSWRFHRFGDIGNLQMEDVSVPEPADGEVLVKVDYAALNPADAYLVKGQYPRAGQPPFAVGRDGAGTVVKAGGPFREGDAVVLLRSEVGVSREGTLAEYVTVPHESLAAVPPGWQPEEAAAAPLVFLTAWQAVVEVGGIPVPKELQELSGQTEPRAFSGAPVLLITGASGGVGTAALMLGKALGCRVVALSRSESKREALRKMGADIALDSEDPKIVERAREALGGGRADVVVENLGGPYLQKSLDMAGHGGRIGVVGLLAGLHSEIQVAALLFKKLRIEGVMVGGYKPEEAQKRWQAIVALLDRQGVRPPIDRIFPMEQVQEAFARLAEGPLGKVLVRFGERAQTG